MTVSLTPALSQRERVGGVVAARRSL